ncbi:MAG TPA: sulfatase-like hydrolase/transferase [Myxococcota bacterium]|nr:sulfatase-like hydrolase/transferase [Myxococcota bacterium]
MNLALWSGCSEDPAPPPVEIVEVAPVHGRPDRLTVVLAVMDTVRSSRTSLCGHERPTTPGLEALRATGASVSCGALAPSSWTVPSHASLFTGLAVSEHGVDSVEGGGRVVRELALHPLDEDAETLAEHFASQGYQTVLVSGNDLLLPPTGLTQGFEILRVSRFNPKRLVLRGADYSVAFDAMLEELDPDRPLFLVMNFLEAHDPWQDIPPGVEWIEPRPAARGFVRHYKAFVRGEMDEVERAAWLTTMSEHYDYGIHLEDQALSRALDRLDERGWTSAGLRLVVTSDHGEYLGEHGLVRHAHVIGEPVARVPLLWWQSDGGHEPLPDQVSARVAYHLTRDGRLPDPLPSLEASVWPFAPWVDWSHGKLGNRMEAVVWQGDDKLHWTGDEVVRYDLAADPAEDHPLSADDHPAREQLESVISSMQSLDRSETAPGMQSALEAIGYLDTQ